MQTPSGARSIARASTSRAAGFRITRIASVRSDPAATASVRSCSRRGRICRSWAFIRVSRWQVVQDRAVGAIIAVAMLRQSLQRAPQFPKRLLLALQLLGPRDRQRLHVGAGPAAVLPRG